MWLLILPIAAAGPPATVDLDDVAHWNARNDALLEGPTGCWEFLGEARVRVAVFIPGGLVDKPQRVETTLAGPFTGRMEDGLWTRLDHDLHPVASTGKLVVTEIPVHPMVGRLALDGGEGGEDPAQDDDGGGSISIGMSGEGVVVGAQAWSQAANLVDEIIEAVDPDTVLVWAGWDEERASVQVVKTMPLGRRAAAGEVTVRSLHPLDGSA